MKMQQITIGGPLFFCAHIYHQRLPLTLQPSELRIEAVCNVCRVAFSFCLVVVLKCHVMPEAKETLNDLLWLDFCVYCILFNKHH